MRKCHGKALLHLHAGGVVAVLLVLRQVKALTKIRVSCGIPIAVSYTHLDVYKRQGDDVANAALNFLERGWNGENFHEVTENLRSSDPYMVMADFKDYRRCLLYTACDRNDGYRELHHLSG